MTRLAASLLALLALVGCQPAGQDGPGAGGDDLAPMVCRIGPDGGPVQVAEARKDGSDDRGIGGTGAMADGTAGSDRGIGGTGAIVGAAPRPGEGGATGVVGVITGFASICVNGLEVSYAADAAVRRDGQMLAASDLRAGQLVILEAEGAGRRLQARSIALRHEVIGPVEAVDGQGSPLLVAGQRLSLAGPVWGGQPWQVGDWVAVSGLRRPDEVIEASRIDPATPGQVLVHGRLRRQDDRLMIGGLALETPPGLATQEAGLATASGSYHEGKLLADSLSPDLLLTDLPSQFSADVTRFVVEAYVPADSDHGRPGFGLGELGQPGMMPGPGRGVFDVERRPDGGFSPGRGAAPPGNRAEPPSSGPRRSSTDGGPGGPAPADGRPGAGRPGPGGPGGAHQPGGTVDRESRAGQQTR